MSTAPSGWQAPKTNWLTSDPIAVGDLNRAEGNSAAIETGSRTLDQALAAPRQHRHTAADAVVVCRQDSCNHRRDSFTDCKIGGLNNQANCDNHKCLGGVGNV